MPRPSFPALAAALLFTFVSAVAAAAPAYAPSAAAQAKPLPTVQRLERRFLQIAAANLRFEAEASRLAQDRTNNPAVKEISSTLLSRQQTVQPEMIRLLHVRGMAPPMPSNRQTKLLRQLGKLNGARFDRLYIDEVVLKSAQADIANYQKVAAQAEDPVLKAWADRQLPSLRFSYAKAGKALPSASLHGQRAV